MSFAMVWEGVMVLILILALGSRIKNNYAGVNIPFFVVCCILSGSHLVMRVIGSVSYQFSPVRVITGSSILTVVA